MVDERPNYGPVLALAALFVGYTIGSSRPRACQHCGRVVKEIADAADLPMGSPGFGPALVGELLAEGRNVFLMQIGERFRVAAEDAGRKITLWDVPAPSPASAPPEPSPVHDFIDVGD